MAGRRAAQTRRPNGQQIPSRSIRVGNEEWDRARRRANFEGLTLSNVAAQLIDGYGKGLINLPTVQKVYGAPVVAEASTGGEQ